jgi:hypothetical protein
MRHNYLFIRSILTWICTGHTLIGLILVAGKRGFNLATKIYGVRLQPSNQVTVFSRPAGAYMLSLAFLHTLAIRDPERYKGVIDATILLFLIRLFQRLAYPQEVYEAFGIAPKRHWLMTTYFHILAGLLILARFRLNS